MIFAIVSVVLWALNAYGFQVQDLDIETAACARSNSNVVQVARDLDLDTLTRAARVAAGRASRGHAGYRTLASILATQVVLSGGEL